MRAHPFLVTVALLSLLASGLVVPASSQSLDLPDSYTKAVEVKEGNLYDPWQRALEKVPFFLEHDTPFPDVEETEDTPAGTITNDQVALGFNDGYLTYEAPATRVPTLPEGSNEEDAVAFDPDAPEDKRVIIAGGDTHDPDTGDRVGVLAEFLLPVGGNSGNDPDLRPTRDWRIYGVEADFYVSCDGQILEAEGEAVPLTLGFDLVRMVEGDEGMVDGPVVYSGAVEGFLPYDDRAPHIYKAVLRDADLGNFATRQGHIDDPAEGSDVFVGGDNAFKVVVYGGVAPIAGDCMLHYGSHQYPSNVRLVTDTATLSAWVEDRHGDYTEALPNATSTDQGQRRMTTKIAQATAWPDYNVFNGINYQDRSWNQKLYDGFDGSFGIIFGDSSDVPAEESRFFYRWMDETNNVAVYDSRLGHNDQRNTLIKPLEGTRSVEPLDTCPQLQQVCGGLNLVTEDFLYTENLEDGRYRLEIYSLRPFMYQESPSVTVGLKGMSMELIDSDPNADKVHEVLKNESTVFRLNLKNLGAQQDRVTVSVNNPGTGWTVEPATQTVTLPAATMVPGRQGVEVAFRVTPDETRVAGSSTTLTFTAVSKFSSEVPNEVLPLTTRVVATKDEGIDLFADDLTVQVEPGKRGGHPIFRAHNLGGAGDAFVVEPKLPTNLRGWSAGATPPGRFIDADSIVDFSLVLNVPEDAVAGDSFRLPVTISRVGDLSVTDTVNLTVEVVLRRGLEFTTPDPLVQMRDPRLRCAFDGTVREAGESGTGTGLHDSQHCSYEAGDNDRSVLYRLALHNPGTETETYTLRGDWENGDGGYNQVQSAEGSEPRATSDGCGGSKHPNDYWRVDYAKTAKDGVLDDEAKDFGHGDPQVIDRIAVPAGATVYRWVEMGMQYPLPTTATPVASAITCTGAFSEFSPSGFYRVVATADNEPGIKQTINLFTERHDATAAANHHPFIEPALDLATSTRPTVQESELVFDASSQEYKEVRHRFYVRNEGTERDNLVVRADQGGNGYTTHLEFIGEDTPGTTGCRSDGKPLPKMFSCNRMGIMDEAYFDLVVRPDAGSSRIEIGDILGHSVQVTNQDTLDTEAVSFQTHLVGAARFEAKALVTSRDAHPGQDVALPFEVRNLGTRDDTYALTVLGGDADWRPRLSTDDQVFIPGQHDLATFLKVQVPETAVAGTSKTFVVGIDSANPDLGSGQVTFTVDVVADAGLAIQGAGGANAVLLDRSGEPQEVAVEALTSSGDGGDPITFRVDRTTLPFGWTVSDPVQTVGLETAAQGYVARATFHVTAPDKAIGTSSVPLVVAACRGTQQDCDAADFTANGDVFMNLQDDVGVLLSLQDPDTVTATLPGGDVVFPVRVQNGGLSADTIILTTTQPANGWSIGYDPTFVSLGPLESRVVDVVVSSPVTAGQGDRLSFILFGTSSLDASEFGQLPLVASIGEFDLEWSTVERERSAAPDERVRFVARIHNNGTLPDALTGSARIATEAAQEAYGSLVDVRMEPSALELAPGQTKEVTLTVRLGPAIGPGLKVPVEAYFESTLDPEGTIAPNFTVSVLDYKRLDVDDDGIAEYAVDRNGDAGDGYEEFREPSGTAGRQTQPAQLIRFLDDDARLRHTVKVTRDNQTVDVVVLRIDGDVSGSGFGDGKRDLFLDDTGDGLPNLYWDPDDGHASRLTVLKDINADGVPDYFVDTSGNGEFDAVYDLARGTFVRLLARYVDDDAFADYVVDKNGNGRADSDETVLFAREGKLIQVTKVDVDGDGKLDDVFDTDGDGNPDYFVPAGKGRGVPITVDRDLNKDGFLDWSYDANRDDRDDHFYDPVSQTGGHAIDARGEFVRNLQEFWYVGALFILVAALFVVLVAVTRR